MNAGTGFRPLVGFLTCFGGVPFAVCAVLSVYPAVDIGVDWRVALLAYGAVILSFLGGIHWGLALTGNAMTPGGRRHVLIASAAPSLTAWIALLLPVGWGTAVCAAALGLTWSLDRYYARQGFIDEWFAGLRTRISLIAIGCLTFGIAGG